MSNTNVSIFKIMNKNNDIIISNYLRFNLYPSQIYRSYYALIEKHSSLRKPEGKH